MASGQRLRSGEINRFRKKYITRTLLTSRRWKRLKRIPLLYYTSGCRTVCALFLVLALYNAELII